MTTPPTPHSSVKLNLLFFFKFNYIASIMSMAHEDIETSEDATVPI
jgi:hypothetical protein